MKQIDVLPDDALLGIFDFYVIMNLSYERMETWKALVHVCRRWRSLVFQSPRRLNLQLYCTPKTPVREKLDIWPALPLFVSGRTIRSQADADNIIAALGQSSRVCHVDLELAGRHLEEVFAAMQVPFPELTNLGLFMSHVGASRLVIPDSFLGGSAPRLRYFSLSGIPFLGLPKLLLSTNHLVDLYLYDIPDSGYISPEAMVVLISVLSSLETLHLQFRFPQSHPGWESRNLPPIKRSILPALTSLYFQGVTGYLEELVIRIDTPQLFVMKITLFNQIDTPRLAQFINRTSLRAGDKARVCFDDWNTSVELLAHWQVRTLEMVIQCGERDRQLSSIAQVCNPLHSLSTVERLYVGYRKSNRVWKEDAIENTLWLQPLLPFTAVKNLYLSKEFAPAIAGALQELVGGRITEVLPSLQNIFVEGLEPSGPLQENIGQFVAARQLSDHAIMIAISDWDRDWM